MTPHQRSKFRPHFDALEDRWMPAILTPTVSGGLLSITGNSLNDNVKTTVRGSMVVVQDLSSTTIREWLFDKTSVTQIQFKGNAGHDTFDDYTHLPIKAYGGTGNDKLYGGNGNDRMEGGIGHDTINGYGGNDILDGGTGNDSILGNSGNDILMGDWGNDYLSGGTDIDSFDGGPGVYPTDVTTDYDRYRDVFAMSTPVVNGSKAEDVLQGHSYACVVNAAMIATAEAGIDWSQRIIPRGNNYYDVQLYNNSGQAYYERVYFDGSWSDADSQPLDNEQEQRGEFWNILVQRAYLQSYGVNPHNRPDSWGGSAWQGVANSLSRLTGRTTSSTASASANPTTLAAAIRNGGIVVAATHGSAEAPMISTHGYSIQSVRQVNGAWEVQIRNPWRRDYMIPGFSTDDNDDGLLTISWADFTANFTGYVVARR